jgi:uncharacterized protein involved in exopolysaccharide biosynthesis
VNPTGNGPHLAPARESSTDPSGAEPGLREFLTVLFKRKSAILITFVSVVATVTVVTFLLPPTYQAESKLLIKFGRENIYRPEVGDDKSPVLVSNNEEIINSETNILTSRDLISRVVSTITVEQMYPDLVKAPPWRGTPLDAGMERFEKALSVEAIKKSTVIQISLQHEDPRMAARALRLLVEYFKEKHLQAYSDPKSSYLEQQLASYDQRLRESQDQLEAFKQNNRVFSLEEQRSLLLKQRTELDTALKGTENEVKEIQQRISSLKRALQTVSPDVPLSTDTERYRSIDEANSQLLALQLKEQELLRKYTENNQLVVSVRKEMQIVKRFIDDQEENIKGRIRSGQNVVYQDLERALLNFQAELPSQQAKAASLRSQIAELDLEIPRLDLAERELENLHRDLSMNDRNYRTYQEKVEDALILEDLNRQKSANITVIQEAAVPVTPVKPKRVLNMALGLILGALAGLGFAFVSEFWAQALSTPHSAERRLGLPVLASIALRR